MSCGQLRHELPPTHIGFFGNTPEQPKVIFEADLLRSFRNSWLRGMSASNFCASMTKAQKERESERGQEFSGAELDDSTTGGIPSLACSTDQKS